MNNKSINTCDNCREEYCMECSTNEDFGNYCSKECKKQVTRDIKQNKIKNVDKIKNPKKDNM